MGGVDSADRNHNGVDLSTPRYIPAFGARAWQLSKGMHMEPGGITGISTVLPGAM